MDLLDLLLDLADLVLGGSPNVLLHYELLLPLKQMVGFMTCFTTFLLPSYLHDFGLRGFDLCQSNKVLVAFHPEVDALVVPEIRKRLYTK